MQPIKKLLRRLWLDQRGATSVLMTILVTTVFAMAVIVGLSMVRDQVSQQFGDIAVGLDQINQSFSYSITIDGVLCEDASYLDPSPTLVDPVDSAPACLSFTSPPVGGEDTGFPQTTGKFP